MSGSLPRTLLLPALLALPACAVQPPSRTGFVYEMPGDSFGDQEHQDRDQDRVARERRRARERAERARRREDEQQRDRDHNHEHRSDGDHDRRHDQDRGDNPDWPRQDKQDRRRRPQRRHHDKRRGRHRSVYALFSYSDGDLELMDRSLGIDENPAELFRFRTGAEGRNGTGGGVDVKYFRPETDLFDGSTQRRDLGHADIHGFVSGRAGDGRFRVPIRFGPYYNGLFTERTATRQAANYHSIGLRLELAPEFALFRRHDRELAVFANLSAGAHLTAIDHEATDEEYGSSGTTIGFEPGVRYRSGNLELSASYSAFETNIGQSDPERGVALPRVETEFTGVVFTLGFRF